MTVAVNPAPSLVPPPTSQVSKYLPEQLTAIRVSGVIDCLLQNAAEVQGQPAEGKDQHQAENSLGHFPALKKTTKKKNKKNKKSLRPQV